MRAASIAFPSVQEYCDALQHPKKCFRIPELQESVPEMDRRGLPMPRTGGGMLSQLKRLVRPRRRVRR